MVVERHERASDRRQLARVGMLQQRRDLLRGGVGGEAQPPILVRSREVDEALVVAPARCDGARSCAASSALTSRLCGSPANRRASASACSGSSGTHQARSAGSQRRPGIARSSCAGRRRRGSAEPPRHGAELGGEGCGRHEQSTIGLQGDALGRSHGVDMAERGPGQSRTKRGASAMASMRAIQVNEAGRATSSWSQREVPAPGRGEALVRVHACGICHSDSFAKEGGYPGVCHPLVPGHEIAGAIEALGDGRARLGGGPARRRRLVRRQLRLLRAVPSRRSASTAGTWRSRGSRSTAATPTTCSSGRARWR